MDGIVVYRAVRSEEEETLLQKLLQTVMAKVLAAYPFEDLSQHPGPIVDDIDDEDIYSSFPNYPRLRHPRKYQADLPTVDQEDGEPEQILSPDKVCLKNADSHSSLHPGKCPKYT